MYALRTGGLLTGHGRRFLDLQPGESAAVARSAAAGFCLMAANALVRPLRDELGVAGGVENLPWLFLGTLGGMLTLSVVHAVAAARLPRRRFAAVVLGCVAVSLLGLAVAGTRPPAWLADATFIWISVINLYTISLYWGIAADRFPGDQGRRILGLVGGGTTLGAIAGSAVAGEPAAWSWLGLGPFGLLLPASACLGLGATILGGSRASSDDREPRAAPVESPIDPRSRSSGLVALGGYLFLFTFTSAFAYMEQARIVQACVDGPAERTALFARIDLYTNLLALVLQTFLTGRVLNWVGLGATAALLPAVTLLGFVGLAAWPGVTALVGFQVVRRGIATAISRPCRELFHARLARGNGGGRDWKCFFDTAVYRCGDALGAWAYSWVASSAALVVATVSVGWMALGWRLGRLAPSEQSEQSAPDSGGRTGRDDAAGDPGRSNPICTGSPRRGPETGRRPDHAPDEVQGGRASGAAGAAQALERQSFGRTGFERDPFGVRRA